MMAVGKAMSKDPLYQEPTIRYITCSCSLDRDFILWLIDICKDEAQINELEAILDRSILKTNIYYNEMANCLFLKKFYLKYPNFSPKHKA